MGYNITLTTHLKHTSFDGPMSVDREQRNISTPQHEISFHRVQRLHSVKMSCLSPQLSLDIFSIMVDIFYFLIPKVIVLF